MNNIVGSLLWWMLSRACNQGLNDKSSEQAKWLEEAFKSLYLKDGTALKTGSSVSVYTIINDRKKKTKQILAS